MQMATVMMSTTMKPAFLMEEIVVDLMSMAIKVGLVMGFAMLSTTIQHAPMMVETVV